jgi:hypothetical protein
MGNIVDLQCSSICNFPVVLLFQGIIFDNPDEFEELTFIYSDDRLLYIEKNFNHKQERL